MKGNRKKQLLLLPLACAISLGTTALPALGQESAPAVQDVPPETLSAMTEDPVCTARFEWDSVAFNREEFRTCLEQNQSKQWQEINILGWASPPGSSGYNQGLSERRARTMSDFLQEQINGVKITLVQGRGESQEIGRAAQIFVLQRGDGGADGVAQGQNAAPAVAEEQSTAAPDGTPQASGAQPINPGFATGPDANPGDNNGDNLADVTPTPGAAVIPAPADPQPNQEAARGSDRDLSWLGAFGLVGLVPFLRKRRNGVR